MGWIFASGKVWAFKSCRKWCNFRSSDATYVYIIVPPIRDFERRQDRCAWAAVLNVQIVMPIWRVGGPESQKTYVTRSRDDKTQLCLSKPEYMKHDTLTNNLRNITTELFGPHLKIAVIFAVCDSCLTLAVNLNVQLVKLRHRDLTSQLIFDRVGVVWT